MTTELTKAAQQALERLKIHRSSNYCNACEAEDEEAISALERALTTSQPAQAGEVDERVAFPDECVASGQSCQYGPHGQRGEKQCRYCGSPPSLPTQPAAQATPEPVSDFFVLDDDAKAMIVNSHHYTPADIRALIERFRSFADPEQTDLADWDNLDWRALCNITWRVMMGLACDLPPSATPPQQAAGEPVGTVVHAKLNGQAKPWVTVALNQDADLPDGTKLFTHPAPGVPEGWEQVGFTVSGDVTNWARDFSMYRTQHYTRPVFAAAQAKGADPEDLAAAGVMLMGRRTDHA